MADHGPSLSAKVGNLLSTRTTTGWLDWMHGELWLFEDGILRVPLGWKKTVVQSIGLSLKPTNEVIHSFGLADFARLASERRNVWISRDMLVSAELRQTIFIGELKARLVDGRSIHLLWLPREDAFPALRWSLTEWLGDRLVARRTSVPPPL